MVVGGNPTGVPYYFQHIQYKRTKKVHFYDICDMPTMSTCMLKKLRRLSQWRYS